SDARRAAWRASSSFEAQTRLTLCSARPVVSGCDGLRTAETHPSVAFRLNEGQPVIRPLQRANAACGSVDSGTRAGERPHVGDVAGERAAVTGRGSPDRSGQEGNRP